MPNDGKVKTEYYSDNSASLPGIMGTQGPVGFEPGMFKKDSEEHKQKTDSINKVNFIIFVYFIYYLSVCPICPVVCVCVFVYVFDCYCVIIIFSE